MSAESVNRKKLLRVVVRYSRKILEASIHNDLHITYSLIRLSIRKTNFKLDEKLFGISTLKMQFGKYPNWCTI